MKILYVTTISNTVNAFLIPHIKMLVSQGNQVDVAFKIEQEVSLEIYKMGCIVHQLPLQRSPLSINNYRAYKALKRIIIDGEYDIVHTHTPVASAIVRMACKKLCAVKVFYTAHGFHFYKGAPLLNWLIYYPLEKYLSKYTNTIVTINHEDYDRAKRNFKASKLIYTPGVGIDISKFRNVVFNKIAIREELGVPQDAFMVLSVGELNINKNHEVIVRAISKLSNYNVHYVICGKGPKESYLKKLSNELDISENVHIVGFKKNIAEICKSSDVFAFPSFREGLPVSVMEAMACGLPVVCSNIRGNIDLIEDGKGGFLITSDDINGYEEKLKRIIEDSNLRELMGRFNCDYIKKFGMEEILLHLDELYGK